jgi:hypothetical protein
MLIHDDLFSWEGFGGVLELAKGQCRLRIFDLSKEKSDPVTHLKPILVVVSDLPNQGSAMKRMSVRSCCSHVASRVVQRFNIDPQRMVFIEYTPPSTYGDQGQHHLPAKFDVMDFVWHDDNALHPKWRDLEQPLLDVVSALIEQTESEGQIDRM